MIKSILRLCYSVCWVGLLFFGVSIQHTKAQSTTSPSQNELQVQITHTYRHPELKNPADIIRYKNKFVVAELNTGRLAIFDDLKFYNFRHFDPKSINKSLGSPHFLSISPWNTLLISNGWGQSIIEIKELDGTGWKEFSGFDPGFRAPHGICVDTDGWIYVGDSLNSRLVRFKDMQGKDWQVFADHDKKIGYIRELVCREGAVWASNSYEQREGINPGVGANIIKITDFASGRIQEILPTPQSNTTGMMVVDQKILFGFFALTTIMGGIEGKPTLQEIAPPNYQGLGVPYGMFSWPDEGLYLATFFGQFEDKNNLGGFIRFHLGQ